MKTKQKQSAFSSLRFLTGLVAIGTILVVFAVYAGEQSRTKVVSDSLAPAIPTPTGNVTEAWVNRIDGPAHGSDHGHDVKTDADGNVLVTGWIETSTGNTDSYTVKYSPDGELVWAKTYAGSATGVDYGYALAVDQSGNAYVGGFGNGENATFDIFVLKYNSNGDPVWTQRWTSPIATYSAYAYSIAVDNQENVYVTGFMSDGLTDGEFVTLKYDSTGNLQWSARYNGSPNSIDYSNCIVVDEDGNSYITGWSGGDNNLWDFTTIKYSSTGEELWVRTYNGSANDNDFAYRLALDPSGNVYVTGQSVETGSDNDITTIKYSPAGDVLWTKHYDGPADGYDAGQSIAVDAQGNAYVTGNHTTPTGLDCATLKYSTNGDLLWASSYDGPDNSGDVLISIALDDLANVYVSGFVASGGASDFVTIKYDTTTGAEQWVQLYNGPGNSYDGTYVIAVDNNRNVLVTGYSTGDGTDYDYTTIKYSQPGAPSPTPTVTPSVTPTPTVTPTPRPLPSPRARPTPRPRP